MRGTVSTRTATRWRSSERARRLLSVAAALVLAAGAAGCARRQLETYYVPTEGEPRINQDELRDRSDVLLRLECPRLLGGGTIATGVTHLRLVVTREGLVTEAHIERSSGDAQIDGIFGGLAAQLQFDPQPQLPAERAATRVRIGYSCAPGQAVTTVELT